MKYNITHETEYNYSIPVTISQHLIHLEPRKCKRQNWISHDIEIQPKPAYFVTREDIYGNKVTAFSIEEEHKLFKVLAKGTVDVSAVEMPKTSVAWEEVQNRLANPETPEDIEASMFLYPSPLIIFDGAIKRYALKSFTDERPFIEAVLDLNSRIFNDFQYTQGFTKIGTLPSEILRDRKGVCQDFAHFMIACLRSLGLSCGYISGYIIVSRGRDFGDVSPLKGVITGGGPHTLKVAVNVEEIN